MYLRPGEKLTLEELLYGLLLCSGNDAALALTECAGGAGALCGTDERKGRRRWA